MKTMAEVLAEHQDWTYQKNLGYYRSEYLCHCGSTFWSGDHEEDPNFNQAVAAHQAEALAAAGYGPVREAQAEALRDAANELEWHPGTQAWLRARANVVEAARES